MRQVRASAVYALGTFICNSTERTDQANNIDHGVARTLINHVTDASPLVRQVRACDTSPLEIVVALAGLVKLFETQFVSIAAQAIEDEKQRANAHYLTLPSGSTSGNVAHSRL